MGFRAFLVMDNTVARQVIAENGRKWISACFPSWSSRWSCRQWSKWSKMGCRGYLVENGFPRVSRHSPTTCAFHTKPIHEILMSTSLPIDLPVSPLRGSAALDVVGFPEPGFTLLYVKVFYIHPIVCGNERQAMHYSMFIQGSPANVTFIWI